MSQDNKLLVKLERIQPTDWLELIEKCNLNVPLDKLDFFHGQVIGAVQFYILLLGWDESELNTRNKGKAELKSLKTLLEKTNNQLRKINFASLPKIEKFSIESYPDYGDFSINAIQLLRRTEETKDYMVVLASAIRENEKMLSLIEIVLQANSHKKGLKSNYSRNSMVKFFSDTFYEFGGVGKITRNPTSGEYSGPLVMFISGVFEILQIKTSTGLDSLLRELASQLAERP